jgi:plasmid stabilization system protein ParE
MAFKVVWTRQGEESLEEVYDGLAEIDADAADRLLEGIFDTTDVLKSFPHIGARWERRGRRTPFREVQYKRYRIFYRVDDSQQAAYIMRVWHSSRDEPTFPE